MASIDGGKLQAWWSHRQGLDGSLNGVTAAEVLEQTGWARSVGGSGPYLSLFARAGLSRESVDACVAALEICELPSARACTYVLPVADFALGLRVGQAFSGGEMATAAKLGVTEREIEKLCEAVLTALAAGPMDPGELKQAADGAARSLGPEGTKKGCRVRCRWHSGNCRPTGTSGGFRRMDVWTSRDTGTRSGSRTRWMVFR